MLALASGEIAASRLSAGSLVVFSTLLGLLVPICQRISKVNRYLVEAHLSVVRLAETLAERTEKTHNDASLPDLKVTQADIRLEQVSFRYAGSAGSTGLQRVSIHAKRGELVALVGPNGAGKSTLLDLILRFQRPRSGMIAIDGQDIWQVSLRSLRSQIGLVPQDAPVFEGTIAQNVAYGVQQGVPEEQVLEAATAAGLLPIIAKLPDGWQTKIGSRQLELSGGQRQRVALARALAGNPPILILDEATSALDAETDRRIAQTLRRLARDKAVIVAAHRLPTLLAADRIYVLDQGRVVETGTHAELIEQGGV
jgi:ABC-type multidrug transport system fused ATPase/permease subunit